MEVCRMIMQEKDCIQRFFEIFISIDCKYSSQWCSSLSEINKKLENLLEDLNTNIRVLTKVTALTFRKDTLFKDKETKLEQIKALESLEIPDNIIALIIGSTVESVWSIRSMKKAKEKKLLRKEPDKEDKTQADSPLGEVGA